MIIQSLTIRDPELGATRTVDAGSVLKTNLTGYTKLSKVTAKTSDIRLYTFTLPVAQGTALYDVVVANAGKLITMTVGGETLSGIVSADEFELSTIRPGDCGIVKCSLRVRVVTTDGSVGLSVICNTVDDEDGITILDELGSKIYAN